VVVVVVSLEEQAASSATAAKAPKILVFIELRPWSRIYSRFMPERTRDWKPKVAIQGDKSTESRLTPRPKPFGQGCD
jgi:hypothetical protein